MLRLSQTDVSNNQCTALDIETVELDIKTWFEVEFTASSYMLSQELARSVTLVHTGSIIAVEVAWTRLLVCILYN